MDLYEYQGKELLREYGLETLPGIVAGTPEEAGRAAETLGGTVAIKAQVLTGGRGKAGGIKVVDSPREAEEAGGSLEQRLKSRDKLYERIDARVDAMVAAGGAWWWTRQSLPLLDGQERLSGLVAPVEVGCRPPDSSERLAWK